MSHPVKSVALEVMAGKIKQLESDVVRLSSQRDKVLVQIPRVESVTVSGYAN